MGGIPGFYGYLEALADPKHEEHDAFIEWGGDYDPLAFDAQQATAAIKAGLPDWRDQWSSIEAE